MHEVIDSYRAGKKSGYFEIWNNMKFLFFILTILWDEQEEQGFCSLSCPVSIVSQCAFINTFVKSCYCIINMIYPFGIDIRWSVSSGKNNGKLLVRV